jgi:hypothetical protein
VNKVGLILLSFVSFAAFSKTISGTVIADKKLELELKGGTLFIFAKKAGSKPGDGQMPIAVQRVPNPKFPVKFELGPENAMVQGTPFEGPFAVAARYSSTGNASDKTGPEGTTPADKSIKAGDTSVVIVLKKKK